MIFENGILKYVNVDLTDNKPIREFMTSMGYSNYVKCTFIEKYKVYEFEFSQGRIARIPKSWLNHIILK